jgi:hypothetical protein
MREDIHKTSCKESLESKLRDGALLTEIKHKRLFALVVTHHHNLHNEFYCEKSA